MTSGSPLWSGGLKTCLILWAYTSGALLGLPLHLDFVYLLFPTFPSILYLCFPLLSIFFIILSAWCSKCIIAPPSSLYFCNDEWYEFMSQPWRETIMLNHIVHPLSTVISFSDPFLSCTAQSDSSSSDTNSVQEWTLGVPYPPNVWSVLPPQPLHWKASTAQLGVSAIPFTFAAPLLAAGNSVAGIVPQHHVSHVLWVTVHGLL